MKLTFRRTLHCFGSGLAFGGVIYVALRMRTYWLDLDFSKITPLIWFAIVIFAVLYGLSGILLASVWRYILLHVGTPITRVSSIKVYGISQLAKYLPGNIFQFAGRQALGMAAGISAGMLAKSTLWELGLFALAGTLFAWLILPIILPHFPETTSLFFMLGSACLVIYLMQNIIGCYVASAYICQILFLTISAGIFISLLNLITIQSVFSEYIWLTIGGSYIIAWLLGLLTIGAPAGLGVREMLLMLLLNGVVIEVDLLMAILLTRLVTIFGDLLFFILALFITEKNIFMEKNHVL